MKVGFISVPRVRLNGEGPAFVLFSKSMLFNYRLQYCKESYDKVFLLARQGLITPQQTIESRNASPKQLGIVPFKDWQKMIAEQVEKLIPSGSEIFLHGGVEYTRIFRYLNEKYLCHHFLKGVIIGKQGKFYKDYFSGSSK